MKVFVLVFALSLPLSLSLTARAEQSPPPAPVLPQASDLYELPPVTTTELGGRPAAAIAPAPQAAPVQVPRAKPKPAAFRLASNGYGDQFQCPPPSVNAEVKAPSSARPFAVTIDTGAGIFTGGLGATSSPALYLGLVLTYNINPYFAFEGGIHYANYLDSIQPKTGERLDLNTTLIPVTLGGRVYLLGAHAPVSPYLAAGGGMYLRNQNVIDNIGVSTSGSTGMTALGGYGGAGVSFELGSGWAVSANFKYHFIFFPDADQTYGGILPAGSRDGNYVTPSTSVSFAF